MVLGDKNILKNANKNQVNGSQNHIKNGNNNMIQGSLNKVQGHGNKMITHNSSVTGNKNEMMGKNLKV